MFSVTIMTCIFCGTVRCVCVCVSGGGGGGSGHGDTVTLEVIAMVQFLWNSCRSAPKITLCASHPMLF